MNILDVVGDSATLGKPQGSDQAVIKSYLPSIARNLNKHKLSDMNYINKQLQALRGFTLQYPDIEAFTDFHSFSVKYW